jgi:hypothetical protein
VGYFKSKYYISYVTLTPCAGKPMSQTSHKQVAPVTRRAEPNKMRRVTTSLVVCSPRSHTRSYNSLYVPPIHPSYPNPPLQCRQHLGYIESEIPTLTFASLSKVKRLWPDCMDICLVSLGTGRRTANPIDSEYGTNSQDQPSGHSRILENTFPISLPSRGTRRNILWLG